MYWIIGISSLIIIGLYVILCYEKRKNQAIIKYLETYGNRSCILYKKSSSFHNDSAVIRDINGEMHRINTSDLVLVGKIHDSDTYELIFKNDQIIRINGKC